MKKMTTIVAVLLIAATTCTSFAKIGSSTLSEKSVKSSVIARNSMHTFSWLKGEAKKSEAKPDNSGGDCEKFLKDYEAFVNSYVAFMKKYKANPTDMTLLANYSKMLEKAGKMEDRAKDCNDDPKFAARLAKIATKMAAAAL